MKTKNFIPAHRLDARRRRRRVQIWTLAAVAFAAVLIAAQAYSQATWGVDGETLDRQLRQSDDEIQRTGGLLRALQAEIAQDETKLKAAQAVGNQPDWSILLALLADCLDDDVLLRQCELTRREDDSSAGGFVLRLGGCGRTQTAVSQCVLQMERMKLFEAVKLLRTSREPFLNDSAVAFQVECALGGAEGGR